VCGYLWRLFFVFLVRLLLTGAAMYFLVCVAAIHNGTAMCGCLASGADKAGTQRSPVVIYFSSPNSAIQDNTLHP